MQTALRCSCFFHIDSLSSGAGSVRAQGSIGKADRPINGERRAQIHVTREVTHCVCAKRDEPSLRYHLQPLNAGTFVTCACR